MSKTDEARVRLYAQAMYDSHGLGASDYCIRNDRDFWRITALAAIAVADEEQAALRAEVERLTRECDSWKESSTNWQTFHNMAWDSAKSAAIAAQRRGSELERLTRECLDREATETDARERLRQAEATLAAVEALHVPNADGSACQFDGFCWPCETATVVSGD